VIAATLAGSRSGWRDEALWPTQSFPP